MRYKDDWERAQTKFREYWHRANHDRPLVAIQGERHPDQPLDLSAAQYRAPQKLRDRWMDVEWLIRRGRATCEATWFGAEAYPDLWPNLGPDIFAAFLGEDIEFGADTSYAKHGLTTWEPQPDFRFDSDNPWWKQIVAMHEALVADAKGDYFVGVTDLHAGLDGLVSRRGPEALAMDLYDQPEAVKKAAFDSFEVLKEVYARLYAISQKNRGGYSDWMNVWHPGRAFTTSCDFMGMISDDDYREFVEPELKAQLAWFDASIFHLDGPGALRHLDALLELKDLDGVQWVYGAGQPTAAYWLPVLQKIQNAGKCIHVTVIPEDLPVLCAGLRPEGVMFQVSSYYAGPDANRPFTETEARDILTGIERAYKSRR